MRPFVLQVFLLKLFPVRTLVQGSLCVSPLWERRSGGDGWVGPYHVLELRSSQKSNKTNGFSYILTKP